MPSRRAFLAGLGAGGLGALAGCSALNLTREETQDSQSGDPPLPDRPSAVYYPSHVDGMLMSGTQTRGGLGCALTYTRPHRFWLVSGRETTRVPARDAAAIHVMPVVWHVETGTVLTDRTPTLRFHDGDALVTADAPWPMLSQRMGFHFGDNVVLPGDGGTYDVSVRVGAPAVRRTGALAGGPDAVTFDFSLAYSQAELDAVSRRYRRDAGERGAVDPMGMEMLPAGGVPAPAALPGRVLGTATTGDAAVVATVLDGATAYGGDGSQRYLAVSIRTPYNRYPLPMTGLRAEIAGETHDLTETLDPELGHHYGVALDEAPDAVDVTVTTPPQVSRHEGYETAFLDMPAITIDATDGA
ncbi:iron transporter [Halarchaeum grantii]|uniref:Iron transporter n=1 Tax=Halarchaeum grantii TaxID=1193105 RepID=A0A830ERH4_9EURY|nr:hypothetical protein [Halarchaeum grantii]GGL22843.1 iron transporter [Halarchaeum grantii]